MNSSENFSKSSGHEVKMSSNRHCHYLGLLDDPETIFNFPSLGNFCYRCRPPSVPLLEHQHKTCLTNSYTRCPVFVRDKGNKLPKNLSEPTNYETTKRNLLWIIVGVVFVALISVVFLLGQNIPAIISDFIEIPSSTVVQQTKTVEETYQATNPSQETLENATSTAIIPLVTEEATKTVASDAQLKLDFPIGSEQKYIIHSVLDGESIEQYAIQYNTNKETIIDVNYFLPIPLWINWLIIIPVDLPDANDLPTFEAYVVINESITVEGLAEKLSIDSTELGYYNGVESDYVLKSGNWLLIPREGYFFFKE